MNNIYRWRFNSVCLVFCLAGIVSISGCGDFFAAKPTEIESMNILRELSHVDLAPKQQLFEPDIYKKKPQIVEGKIGDKTESRSAINAPIGKFTLS